MRKKQMASCCLCTAAMVLLLGKTAYAWEPVDTNGDGVLDSIMFCDGYCDSIECSYGHDGYIAMSLDGTQGYSEPVLNRLDEMCRKNPGYVKRIHEEKEAQMQEEEVVSEIGHQMEAKIDEIAGQCFNDSMTVIEKFYAALEYFDANYPFDDNAPKLSNLELYGSSTSNMRIRQEFLMKTRVLNKEQRNQMIRMFVLPDYDQQYGAREGGMDIGLRYYTMAKYFHSSMEEPYRFRIDPYVVGPFFTYFIDGKLYSLNVETLELIEGWTEETKQKLRNTTFCLDRTAYFSEEIARSPEKLKWIPEEFKKFLKDNGCHAPWLQ